MIFNLGDLEFTEADTTYLECNPMNFADMDGNGSIDIIGSGGTACVGIVYNDGTGRFVSGPLPSGQEQNIKAKLSNYPNPFNVKTVFEFELPESGDVVIDIFNCRGQKVHRLKLGYRVEGRQSVMWNGMDGRGRTLPSGVYLCRLSVHNKAIAVGKVLLIK